MILDACPALLELKLVRHFDCYGTIRARGVPTTRKMYFIFYIIENME